MFYLRIKDYLRYTLEQAKLDMITVEDTPDDWTIQEHLRVVTILKNSNPVGYINKGPGDTWEKIISSLQTNLLNSLIVEQQTQK